MTQKVPPRVLGPALILLLLSSQAGSAQYLDPGSASVIVQAVVAAVVAVGAGVKLYWHRISAFFARRGAEETESQ